MASTENHGRLYFGHVILSGTYIHALNPCIVIACREERVWLIYRYNWNKLNKLLFRNAIVRNLRTKLQLPCSCFDFCLSDFCKKCKSFIFKSEYSSCHCKLVTSKKVSFYLNLTCLYLNSLMKEVLII